MYYFIYGEDVYSIKRKINTIKDRFLEKDLTGLNISEIDGGSMTLNQFFSVVWAAPFLYTKRLIIIKNLLLDNADKDLKKEIASKLEEIPESSVVFFAESGLPDARTSLFKSLNKPKIAQKFGPITQNDLSQMIGEKCDMEGVKIVPDAKIKLINNLLEGDLWLAENEITKLILYSKTRTEKEKAVISEKNVDEMVRVNNASNIFKFVEALAHRNSQKAINDLFDLTNNGENELYIFSMIVYQYRVMLIISDLMKRGHSQKEIASLAKLHPFVVEKTKSILKSYSIESIRSIYQKLQEADYKMKSGQVLPCLCLELLIVDLCKKPV